MLTNCLAAYVHLPITVCEIERDICEKSSFYHNPPLHSTPPLGGFPSECRHLLWYGKTRMVSLPDGEKISKICLIRFDVIHERDGRTDRQTDTAWQQRPRLCIASRGKNANLNHTKWHSQVTVVAVAYSVPVSDTQWRWRPLRLMSTHCCCLMTS